MDCRGFVVFPGVGRCILDMCCRVWGIWVVGGVYHGGPVAKTHEHEGTTPTSENNARTHAQKNLNKILAPQHIIRYTILSRNGAALED